MSITQVLEELPAFTVAERQLLVLRAIELDDPRLSPENEKLIDTRLEDHRRDPSSSVSLEAIIPKLTLEESFAAMAWDTASLKEAREWVETGIADGLEED